jgi:nucleotide-binding universal stress UspA family protein
MYQHILLPTDGSELSQKAVDHGIAMAQAINAKVTFLTVTAPFHTLAVEPAMVTDTRDQHDQHVAASATNLLSTAKMAKA